MATKQRKSISVQDLPHDKAWELRSMLTLADIEYATYEDGVTTTNGNHFTYEDSCELAYMVWQRMGQNAEETHRAWCVMMQSNPTVTQVLEMVAYHVYLNRDWNTR